MLDRRPRNELDPRETLWDVVVLVGKGLLAIALGSSIAAGLIVVAGVELIWLAVFVVFFVGCWGVLASLS